MATLPELPAVTSLSKYVTRILGQNPSKFTLQGTNSYLVHHPHSTRMILIDTTGPSSSGPLAAAALSSYLTSLRSVIAERPTPQGGGAHAHAHVHVSDIILTHWHRDHTAALPDVIRALALVQPRIPVRVWKFPCANEAEEDDDGDWKSERGRDAAIEHELAAAATSGLGSTEIVVQPDKGEGEGKGKRIHVLRPGHTFRLEPELLDREAAVSDADADAIELEVVHTPGHTSDSICLVLRHGGASSSSSSSSSAAADNLAVSTPPPPLGVFTADTVLGHGTAVFASLSSYLSSLSRLITSLSPSSPASSDPGNPESQPQSLPRIPLFPGHGDVVDDAIAKITEYRSHRLERERQVVQVLERAQRDESGPLTADELVDQIYGSTIPVSLKPAATHGCLLHLAKLLEEKIVVRVADAGKKKEEEEEEGSRVMVEHEELQIPEGWYDGWSIAVTTTASM